MDNDPAGHARANFGPRGAVSRRDRDQAPAGSSCSALLPLPRTRRCAPGVGSGAAGRLRRAGSRPRLPLPAADFLDRAPGRALPPRRGERPLRLHRRAPHDRSLQYPHRRSLRVPGIHARDRTPPSGSVPASRSRSISTRAGSASTPSTGTTSRRTEPPRDAPIQQSTRLFQGPSISVGLRYFLKDRGQQVGRFVWVPTRWNAFVGGGHR